MTDQMGASCELWNEDFDTMGAKGKCLQGLVNADFRDVK
jgi:hypothetical protein